MAMFEDLIREEADGKIGFGDYTLTEKKKVENYPHLGDMLKVKTFNEITRLEKNGMFLYESVPGTAVSSFIENEDGISFNVSGNEDAQVTVGLADNTEYVVSVNGSSTGVMKTALGGKLSISVELAGVDSVSVDIKKK